MYNWWNNKKQKKKTKFHMHKKKKLANNNFTKKITRNISPVGDKEMEKC